MLKKWFCFVVICVNLLSLFSCETSPYISLHSAFHEKGFLQSSLFDRNLYQNLMVVDDRIYLYDRFVSNNIFVMETNENQIPYYKHLLKGCLFEHSPLHLADSITNDSYGNLYILDNNLENRGPLRSPVIRFYDYKGEYLIYRYDLSEQKLQLLHRISYDNSSDDYIKLFWWNNGLMLLSRSKEQGYLLSSLSLDSSEKISQKIHRFENDILDIDVSGNILVVLEKGGIVTEYTFDGEQLSINNQITLPSKDFTYSDFSYKILYTHHNSHYLVYKTIHNLEGQAMINAFFVMQNSELLLHIPKAPSSLIAFAKTSQTVSNQMETILALENRAGKIYHLEYKLPLDG